MLCSDILTNVHPVEILQRKMVESVMNYLPKYVESVRYTKVIEGIVYKDHKTIRSYKFLNYLGYRSNWIVFLIKPLNCGRWISESHTIRCASSSVHKLNSTWRFQGKTWSLSINIAWKIYWTCVQNRRQTKYYLQKCNSTYSNNLFPAYLSLLHYSIILM